MLSRMQLAEHDDDDVDGHANWQLGRFFKTSSN